jgi:hypothetical protein
MCYFYDISGKPSHPGVLVEIIREASVASLRVGTEKKLSVALDRASKYGQLWQSLMEKPLKIDNNQLVRASSNALSNAPIYNE